MSARGGHPATQRADHHALVLQAQPIVGGIVRKLRRAFPRVAADDLAQSAMEGVLEALPSYDPAKGPFPRFAWQRAYGKALDAALRDRRQTPRYFAMRALLATAEHLEQEEGEAEIDPFADVDPAHERLLEVCHDGAFAAFFGGTFEAWRSLGEDGVLGHLERQTAFRALQAALGVLDAEAWRLLELYYVDLLTWAEVGAQLGVSERQAKRRDHDLREALRRELRRRGVDQVPPSVPTR